MKKLLLTLCAVAALSACQTPSATNEAGFVTLLGNDTLAVESFTKSDDFFTAKVVLRSPSISLREYNLTYIEGDFQSMEVLDYAPENGFEGQGKLVQRMTRQQDSLIVESEGRNGMTSRTVAFEKGMLPFIDMVHWPYELAFNNAAKVANDSIDPAIMDWKRLFNLYYC